MEIEYNSKTIALRICEAMKKKNIKSKELSKKLKLSEPYINMMRSGHCEFNKMDRLQKIADVLDTTVDDLLADYLNICVSTDNIGDKFQNNLKYELKFMSLEQLKVLCITLNAIIG